MIPSLSQEALTQYASDAQTIQQPQGADYSQGVKAGRTIPAKWWNWLFSNVTKRIVQSRSDANNMLTEMKNVVIDAGLTPAASNNTQLKQAIEAKTNVQINNLIQDKQQFINKWILCDNSGLLPANTDSPADTRRYFFRDIHCVHGVYFAENITYSTRNQSEQHAVSRIAYSYDLENWYLIKPSDIAPTYGAWFDSDPFFKTGVVYFKDAWYFTFYFARSIHTYYWQTLVRVPDLENLSLSTEVYTRKLDTEFASCGAIFILNDKLYYNDSYGDMSVSEDGINFTKATTSGVLWSFPLAAGPTWMAPEVISFGSNYIVGNLLISADLSTWTILTSMYGLYDSFKLRNGGVVMYFKDSYSIGEHYNCWYIAPGASQATEYQYEFVKLTYDSRYVVLKANNQYYITEDFVTIVNTKKGVANAEPIDGVFYATDSDFSGGTIYKTTNPMSNTWEDTGHSSVGALYTLAGLPFLVDKGNNKFSRDFGVNWIQAKDSAGNNFCATEITLKVDNKYFCAIPIISFNVTVKPVVLCYATRSVNYVQGHTLYLR